MNIFGKKKSKKIIENEKINEDQDSIDYAKVGYYAPMVGDKVEHLAEKTLGVVSSIIDNDDKRIKVLVDDKEETWEIDQSVLIEAVDRTLVEKAFRLITQKRLLILSMEEVSYRDYILMMAGAFSSKVGIVSKIDVSAIRYVIPPLEISDFTERSYQSNFSEPFKKLVNVARDNGIYAIEVDFKHEYKQGLPRHDWNAESQEMIARSHENMLLVGCLDSLELEDSIKNKLLGIE